MSAPGRSQALIPQRAARSALDRPVSTRPQPAGATRARGGAAQPSPLPQKATGTSATAPWRTGLPPVIARSTRLIVLGSFPGEASLAAGQYYAHPRNQFWPIVAELLGLELQAMPYRRRLDALRAGGIGLWDVYASCRRVGSLDSAIEDAQPNDLASLRRRAPQLQLVAHNGGESARSMKLTQALGLAVLRLPSTSPANASWSFERKLAAWRAAFAQAGLA